MSFAALFSKNKYDSEHVKTAIKVTPLPTIKTDTQTGPVWIDPPVVDPNTPGLIPDRTIPAPPPITNAASSSVVAREFTSESMVGASPAVRAAALNVTNKPLTFGQQLVVNKPEKTMTTTAANPVLVVIEGIEQEAQTLLTNLAHPPAAQVKSSSPSTPLTPTTAASLGVIIQNVEKVLMDAAAYATNPVGAAINVPFDVQTILDILSFWPTTKAEVQNKLGIISQS